MGLIEHGFTYPKQEEVVDIGAVQETKETQKVKIKIPVRILSALLFICVTASAQSASPVTASSLQQLLDQYRFLDFQEQLGHACDLTTEQPCTFLACWLFMSAPLKMPLCPWSRLRIQPRNPGPSVLWFERDGLENQQVQRSLH
jgi:hypothetical protein